MAVTAALTMGCFGGATVAFASEASDTITFITQAATDGSEVGLVRDGTNSTDAKFLPQDTCCYDTMEEGTPLWYTFTTPAADNKLSYDISIVDKSDTGNYVRAELQSANGESLGDWRTDGSGNFSTKYFELDPDTTYYILTSVVNYYGSSASDSKDFMIYIREEGKATAAYETTASLSAARGSSDVWWGDIRPMTNVDDVYYLPLNMQFGSSVHDGIYSWFAFTTCDTGSAASYTFQAVHQSKGAQYLNITIYDSYGNQIDDWRISDEGNIVSNDVELNPDSTYYLRFRSANYYGSDGSDTIEYTFVINAPSEAVVSDLLFETPYEVNETQVMFESGTDTFLDRDAAKTALKPLADALLEQPDRSILIAGTTETNGNQADQEELSSLRAEAVKDLLVNDLKVPASQIETIGLGYENDPFVRGHDRVEAGDLSSDYLESEGKKNRRVVILDLDDPIAQEILSNPGGNVTAASSADEGVVFFGTDLEAGTEEDSAVTLEEEPEENE